MAVCFFMNGFLKIFIYTPRHLYGVCELAPSRFAVPGKVELFFLKKYKSCRNITIILGSKKSYFFVLPSHRIYSTLSYIQYTRNLAWQCRAHTSFNITKKRIFGGIFRVFFRVYLGSFFRVFFRVFFGEFS